MSTNFQRPSAEGRYILEIDGIPAIAATEATPPGKKHTAVKYQPGNQPNPIHIRGNYEIEECSFKHARVIGQVGNALVAWLDAFASGDFVELKNARFITLDESGRTPMETWELIDCVPTMYKPDNVSGAGTNVATFSFSLQPTEARKL
jgi:hypothetical protein